MQPSSPGDRYRRPAPPGVPGAPANPPGVGGRPAPPPGVPGYPSRPSTPQHPPTRPTARTGPAAPATTRRASAGRPPRPPRARRRSFLPTLVIAIFGAMALVAVTGFVVTVGGAFIFSRGLQPATDLETIGFSEESVIYARDGETDPRALLRGRRAPRGHRVGGRPADPRGRRRPRSRTGRSGRTPASTRSASRPPRSTR